VDSAPAANAAYYDLTLARAGLRGQHIETTEVVQSRHIFNQYVIRCGIAMA